MNRSSPNKGDSTADVTCIFFNPHDRGIESLHFDILALQRGGQCRIATAQIDVGAGNATYLPEFILTSWQAYGQPVTGCERLGNRGASRRCCHHDSA